MHLFDNTTLNKIKNILLQRQETVSVSESVTSGLIQFALSQPSNASGFFEGGLTVYNIGQKAKHLNIPPILALSCDSVSKEVSEKMALNVAQSYMSTYGIAITGYATLSPENKLKNLYAFVSIVCKNKVIYKGVIQADREMEGFKCQLFFTQKVLDLFLEQLQKA